MPHKDPKKRREYDRQYRQSHREKILQKQRRWVLRHPERRREIGRNHYYRNKEYYRRHQLKDRYGLELEDYYEMVERQNGKCAICDKPPHWGILAVDHCHQTGKVRGLLCKGCNTAIGHFKDDPALFRRITDYLTRHAS